MIWNDLHKRTMKQTRPAGFQGSVGAVVPGAIKIEPITGKAASDVPALRSYDFAMVQCKLLVVNPSNKKIVDVDHHRTCTRSWKAADLGG